MSARDTDAAWDVTFEAAEDEAVVRRAAERVVLSLLTSMLRGDGASGEGAGEPEGD